MKEVLIMLIDIFFGLLAIVTTIDLIKLFVDQVVPHYTPKHGRRWSM